VNKVRIVGFLASILIGLILILPSHNSMAGEEIENTAVVELPKIEDDFYDWFDRHSQILALNNKTKPNIVFIGDSITHCFGGDPSPAGDAEGCKTGAESWDKYFKDKVALNMGFGWDRTQNVLWRLSNGEFEGINPKIVVLLIGTNNLVGTENARNNSPSEIAQGISKIINVVHAKSPDSKIVLMGIFPRTPSGTFKDRILKVNSLIAPIADKPFVTFLNISDQLDDAEFNLRGEYSTDGTHLNKEGYEIWAKTLFSHLNNLSN
jgi:lysophospholipase L1-like esterase